MKRIWIFDLETLNYFTACFVDRDSDEIRTFVIGKDRDDRKLLFDFLNTEVDGLIGYNSIFFDAQIIEYMYRYPNCTAENIRSYAYAITQDNNRRPDVAENNLRHKHLDLFRALSLSVKAKRTSLKWTEYQIDFDNIEDMPSQGEGDNWLEMILSYNLNDVLATKALYFKNIHEIELRKTLTKREGINLMNSTEPDMAKKLFAKYLSKAMGISEWDLRSMGTDRNVVKVSDIIFPYIEFKTEKLQQVLEAFKKLELAKKDKFDFTINWQGIDIVFGLGGLHGSPNNKIIESDDKYVIKSFDATSYYPHLMFKNDLCPEHLPKEIFLPLYEGFYHERQSIPKKDPRNYILKILLNSSYGLTNDEYSFLRDRLVTLAICINGQLLLSMLFERLTLEISNTQLIMCNTDGAEVLMPREYEDKYQEICKWWENLTQIPLEHVEYQKLIIGDVNNYIALYTDNKTKTKGRFEFENIPLHKNKSHSIIPRAIYNYFIHDISVEETILNHRNIFDFCAGVRAKKSDIKGASHYELQWIDGDKLASQKLSKTVRYYISKKGKYLFKCYEDGSKAHVEAPLNLGKMKKDWKVTYFNKAIKYDNFDDFGIDYSYYIYHAKKQITDIINKEQLKLF